MISNGHELYKYVDAILLPLGYIRKKETYYLDRSECICIFVLTKEDFGGYYGPMMGCFLKQLLKTGDKYPVYYKKHFHYDIALFTDRHFLHRVFDLENQEFKEQEREHFIKEILELYIIPFLEEVCSKEGILSAYQKYPDLYYYMKGALREALGIPQKEEDS